MCGVWRCQLKTFWGCYSCWCWLWGSCWQQFVADLETEVWHFCSDFKHKVWSRFWSWSSREILKLNFGQYFAADVWLRLQTWILVKILSLNLVELLMFDWDFEVMLNWDSEIVIWSRFGNCELWTVNCKLVIWTQPSGPLCLWQCFAVDISYIHYLFLVIF